MTDETGHAARQRVSDSASVSSRLLWLMLACLLPGLLGTAFILHHSYLDEREQLAQDTSQTARALMQAVDAEFARIQSLTQTLAMSEKLANNDLAAFHAKALRLVQLTKFDHNYVLSNATGQQLVNTLLPYPSKLPIRGSLEQVHRVFSTGQPAISDLYFGPVRQQQIIAIDVPVWKDGRVAYVLSFSTVPAAFLGEILKKQQLPPDWVVSFFDPQGKIAFRSHLADRFVGQKGTPALLARMAQVTDGMAETNTLEGIPVTSVFSRSLTSNWSVAIGIPTDSFTAKLHRHFLWLAGVMIALLGAGSLLALTLSKRIGGAVQALREPALALGRGEVVTVAPLCLKEANEVGAVLVSASHILRQTESQLLESNAKLTTTLHRLDTHLRNSPLAFIEFDENFKVLLWSAQAERLFGWSEEAMLGRVTLGIKWVHEDDIEQVRQTWEELQSGVCISNIRINRNYRRDGTVIDCEWYNSALHDADGNLVSILSQVLDVTERKRGEAQFLVAIDAAEQANNAKSRFLAAASHDLRQPLSALSLYTGVLNNLPQEADRKVVANMQSCIDSLSGLLTDLLDLSKLQAGVVNPNIVDFSVAGLFGRLASVHAPKAQAKGLRLRFIPSTLTGKTDLMLLARSLGNLIENALRYTERGGVLVACRHRLGKTWIEVWDTGVGIPNDQKWEIFEEFKQLGDGARNMGSGLGLAIVAKTATLLGLEVRVRSQLGRGSVFAIELPLGQAISVKPAPAPNAHMFRPLRIALVDDNDIVREALVLVLQHLGH